MSTLTKAQIIDYIKRPIKERLVITPLLDFENQVKDTAIDLRLGTEFIITRKTNLPALNPIEREKIIGNIGAYQSNIKINYHEPIILHPNQLLLGSTLEYICIPANLSGYVIGRSSWGRLGLIIATATFINPCFKGCLTLELLNLGEVPLVLYPGFRICQLILHSMGGVGDYSSRYICPVGPEFSKVYEDREIGFWGPPNNQQ